MLDLAAIIAEVEKGCPNEVARQDSARECVDFYRGDFAAYTSRPAKDDYEAPRYERVSLIMQRVVNVLTEHLYAKGPAREFPDAPDLTAWLQGQYQWGGLDGLMQEADRLAMAADVAAIQVVDNDDPERPVRFQVWPADQFVVWVDPADPTRAAAVATIDLYDQTRRMRLWTAESVLTFATDKLMPGQTADGTAYRLQAEDDNYLGCLPFAFVRAVPATTQFWSSGPGSCLKGMNDWINYSLTDVGDSLRYCAKPILAEYGCGSKPPQFRPGVVWHMTAAALDEARNGIPPRAEYLQPDPSFVDAHWGDLQSYIDHVLETIGVPPAAVRMVQASAKSGLAIVAEQLPLILWATGRQRPFAVTERELARVTIKVGEAVLHRLGAPSPAWLDPGQADVLALRWPSLVPDVPAIGEEADAADQRSLALGILSRIQLVMRRFNLTREAALAHLQAVAADLAEETKLGLPPIPTTTLPGETPGATDGEA